MNLNEERTLANINYRAQRITEDYYCTVYPDGVVVTRKDEPGRSYEVKDGACSCRSFTERGTCKHSLGIVALVDAEVERMEQLNVLLNSDNLRRAIANGKDIAEAARCEMSLELYRATILRFHAEA